MSEDCIFCSIIAGDVPSNEIAETDTAYAFLDVNPLTRGHTLVIPKDHYGRLGDVPADVAGGLFELVTELTPAVEAAVDADGSTVAVNNGEAAGQAVPHVHCHIVPRFEGDGGGAIHSLFDGVDLSEAELAEVAGAIRDAR